MWSPPRPQDIVPTATTWLDWQFFHMGGAGGPSEEPRLHINWPLMLFKIVSGMLGGYLIIFVAFRVFMRRPFSHS